MVLGVITGSGLYELEGLTVKEERSIGTPYGAADVTIGSLGGKDIAFIARHGRGHEFLPNLINYRANILALNELGVKSIIASSVMGVVDPNMQLGEIILFEDMLFADNRLPDGAICTFFDKPGQPGRGHYIFSSPYSTQLRDLAARQAAKLGMSYSNGGIYGHVNGPRFNSKAEIRLLQNLGVSAISQTAGPEAILAGELEIPYLLIGFGIDYANGVASVPTPIEVLDSNLGLAAEVVPKLIREIVVEISNESVPAEGFVYRFD